MIAAHLSDVGLVGPAPPSPGVAAIAMPIVKSEMPAGFVANALLASPGVNVM